MPWYAWYLLGLLSASPSLLFVLGLCFVAGRHPRRGGYVRPPASSTPKAGTPTHARTLTAVASSSSSTEHGGAWEAPAILRTRASLSNATGRGLSGSVTAGPGVSGLRRGDVDWSRRMAERGATKRDEPA